MRRAIPHLVVIGVIGLLALTFRQLLSVLAEPPSAIDKKTSEAARVLCYRLLEDQSVTFRLSGSEDVLKVVTHVVLTDTPLPESGTVDYGIAFELRSPSGAILWQTEVHTRSRQSKADLQDGVWLHENAFSLSRGVEVTDDRVLLVTLPNNIPVNSEIRLSKLGGYEEVAVRAYERQERSSFERRLALQTLDPGERDSLIARTTFEPWMLVPEWEQLQRLRYRFKRLAAIGDMNVHFLTRPIWYTGFRNSPEQEKAPDAHKALSLSSRRSLALPVSEQQEFELQLSSAATEAPVELSFFGQGEVQTHTLKAQGDTGYRFEVPEGATYASLSTNSEDEIEVTSWGKSGNEVMRIEPDWVRTSWLFLPASSEAIEIPVVLRNTPEERLIRIYARAIGDAAEDLSAAKGPTREASLLVEFLDDGGKRMGEAITHTVDSPPSSYDYFELEGGAVAGSSDVSSIRFIAPRGASTVRLVPRTGPVAVRAFVYSPDSIAQTGGASSAPKPRIGGTRFRERFARSETSRWFELSLHEEESRAVHLRGQKRLDVKHARKPVALAYRTLPALKSVGRRTLLEPVSSEVLERFTAGGWPSSAWASVGRKLSFIGDGKTRTTLRYLVAAADSGKRVTVAVDGAEVASIDAVAPGGSLALGLLSRGRHRLEISTAPRSFRALLNNAPTGPGNTDVWRAREVYPVGPRGLDIPFALEANDRRISAVIFAPYDTSPEGASIEFSLDGGEPRRIAGQSISRYTEATRRVPLPDSVAQSSLFFPSGAKAGYQRIVSAPLGDDIESGRHLLHVRSVGGERLWASFFVSTGVDAELEQKPALPLRNP